MKLGIYSLKKILYQGEALSINCKTAAGEITVLDHHRPLVAVLTAGTIKIIDREQKEHYIPVSSGFIEINPNQARLIVET